MASKYHRKRLMRAVPGDTKTRVLITYVVEKGKPIASPA
jgi:hypothetical protein